MNQSMIDQGRYIGKGPGVLLSLVLVITLGGMAEGDVSDLFSDVSDMSSQNVPTLQRQTVLDQIEQQFIPKFKRLSFNRQFEILVEGFEPDNPEMKRFNSKKPKNHTNIQTANQTFSR